MTIYVWCLTDEVQEAANATRWREARGAKPVATTRSRQTNCLENMKTGDSLVIVAHGSRMAIGTSHGAVSYTSNQLALALVTNLKLPNAVHVFIAACHTRRFAEDLQSAIRVFPTHPNVVCSGQAGEFVFSADYRP